MSKPHALNAVRATYDHVLETEGHRRIVQGTATTIGRLYRKKQIPPHFATAFDKVAKAAANALGAATEDYHFSTAKLIARYDGIPVDCTQYGSRSIAVQQLSGERQIKWIADHLPPEMRDLFDMCLREEIGALTGRALTLEQLGRLRGYASEKQASASGSTQVFDMLAVVVQLRREYLEWERKGKVHLKPRREWPAELR